MNKTAPLVETVSTRVGNTTTLVKNVSALVEINPTPRFDLSPHLYMQFMEPLGTTDSSVEAAWDHMTDTWRADLVDTVCQLAPTMIRWGGCYSSFYRWKEGVGPRNQRPPMYNLLWGGVESNQVGTHEFVSFCRRVGADPLLAVNFESDGRMQWAYPPRGGARTAGPEEAAEWVDYCNNPGNLLRHAHGYPDPYCVHFWQIGNETSYDPKGYPVEVAARRTLAFSKAMRQVDPSIALIGWGDGTRDFLPGEPFDFWAPRMLEVAGEALDYIAFHYMYNIGKLDPGFDLRLFRSDPARTWDILMNAYKFMDGKISAMREVVSGYSTPIAITEHHFGIPGRNRNEVLSTWGAGVSYGRILNVLARHGDAVKIATCADFFGNRWLVNAVMIPTPMGKLRCYLMPVASVMALFRGHSGEQAVDVTHAPPDLDVTASRTGNKFYLHVVNTNRTQAVEMQLQVSGGAIRSGKVFQIAADPLVEIDEFTPDVFKPTGHSLPPTAAWKFPAASVSAVEFDLSLPE